MAGGSSSSACPSESNRIALTHAKDPRSPSILNNTGGPVSYQRFRPDSAKPIMDDIDRVLAKHYGFTDEELDFIINYDIKYRMGREE